MATEIFKRYHPDYSKQTEQQKYYLNAFTRKGFITENTLPKFGKEGDLAYQDRVNRAVFFPFPEKVRNKILKFLESKLDKVKAETTGVEDFAKNIDLSGTTIEKFALQVLNRAIQTGKAEVILTAPLTDDTEITTLKEQEEMGIREYAVLLDVGQIVDWQKDRFGNYRYVIVESLYNFPTNPKEKRKEPARQRTILYRDGFEIYRLIEGKESMVKEFTPYTDENLNRVPVFSIDLGDSPLKDIIELAKRYMQVDSLTEDEFYRVLFDLLLLSADSREVEEASTTGDGDTAVIDISNRSTFTFTNADDKPDILRSETKNAKLKLEYLQDLRKQISDISGMDFTSQRDVYRLQSGESKKMDFLITNANLASFAQKASQLATQILRYCARLVQLSEEKVEKISIEFPLDFNVRTILDQIDEIQALVNAGANYELIKYFWVDFVERNLETTDQNEEEIKTIIESIKNQPEATKNLNFFE